MNTLALAKLNDQLVSIEISGEPQTVANNLVENWSTGNAVSQLIGPYKLNVTQLGTTLDNTVRADLSDEASAQVWGNLGEADEYLGYDQQMYFDGETWYQRDSARDDWQTM